MTLPQPLAHAPLPAQGPHPGSAHAHCPESCGWPTPPAGLVNSQAQQARLDWERPVLEDINRQLAARGQARVTKLTVKLLKEAMAGRTVDGKPIAAGIRTRDQLLSGYRWGPGGGVGWL
jgi:hypothetical protein